MQTNKDFHLQRDGRLNPVTDTTLAKVFPHDTAWSGRGGDEVNGLPRNTLPVGVIQSGVERTAGNRVGRVFRLVECNGELLRLRVCLAMPGEDYEAFAVIHARAPVGSQDAERIRDYMNDNFKRGYLVELPSTMEATLDNARAFKAPRKLSTMDEAAYGGPSLYR